MPEGQTDAHEAATRCEPVAQLVHVDAMPVQVAQEPEQGEQLVPSINVPVGHDETHESLVVVVLLRR